MIMDVYLRRAPSIVHPQPQRDQRQPPSALYFARSRRAYPCESRPCASKTIRHTWCRSCSAVYTGPVDVAPRPSVGPTVPLVGSLCSGTMTGAVTCARKPRTRNYTKGYEWSTDICLRQQIRPPGT